MIAKKHHKIKYLVVLTLVFLLGQALYTQLVVSVPAHAETTAYANEKPIDFKEDKAKAKEWGKEKKKEFKKNLTKNEEKALDDYMSDKNDIQKKFMEKNYMSVDDWDKVSANEISKKEKTLMKNLATTLEKANISETVITYKGMDESQLAFHEELFSGGKPNEEATAKFKQQLLDKNILLDNYLTTELTVPKLENNERILLEVKIPKGGKGSPFTKVKGSIWTNKKSEYGVIVDHSYQLHVNEIKQVIIKGKKCEKVITELQEVKDFKNDINGVGEKWTFNQFKPWVKQLEPAEKNTIVDYVENSAGQMNRYLREDGTGNEKLETKITDLTKALEKASLPENLVVYRRTGALEYGLDPAKEYSIKELDNLIKETIVEHKGFLSTSISSTPKSFESNAFIVRLLVPKGTHGAYLSQVIKEPGLEEHAKEKEFLINKGSKYQIHSVKEIVVRGQKKVVVDAELLSE